jgi:hypothetical protein
MWRSDYATVMTLGTLRLVDVPAGHLLASRDKFFPLLLRRLSGTVVETVCGRRGGIVRTAGD